MCDTVPERFLDGKGRAMTSLRLLAALCATVVWVESCYADCSSLHALAQQHANDMARRNSLDHAGFMAASWAGGSRCRECSDGMRDRGLCKANVDAVAAAPREHDARRMPGHRECGISQWPPVLGDGDRRQQSCWYAPHWRDSRSSHPQRQRSRWRCRPGFLHRWKQRAVIGDVR